MLKTSVFIGGSALASSFAMNTAFASENKKSASSPPLLALEPKPLPFNPARLKGISEKLITSHHAKNYTGAVKNLIKVRDEFNHLTKDATPFLAVALKERELLFHNSMILHELYFGNLGGDGKPLGSITKRLSDTYGGSARWEELFRLTGMGLSGGSGWVILGYDLRERSITLSSSANHSQIPAQTCPLLVMDMYEHSYQMDYGADAARYIDAYFQNIAWEEVNHRFESAEKIASS